MGILREKTAYLKGMAQGLSIGADTNEGRLLHAIIDTLGEFADEIESTGDTRGAAAIGAAEETLFVCPSCGAPVRIDGAAADWDEQVVCSICGEPIAVLTSEL